MIIIQDLGNIQGNMIYLNCVFLSIKSYQRECVLDSLAFSLFALLIEL